MATYLDEDILSTYAMSDDDLGDGTDDTETPDEFDEDDDTGETE